MIDLALTRPAWMNDAACADSPENFFPLPNEMAAAKRAKAVCAGCPVKSDCLAYAMTNDLRGIWGGTGERERRRVRGERIPSEIQHGTNRGYQTHLRRKDQPCDACRLAMNEYHRQYRSRTSA